MSGHAVEVERGDRFEFGKNWRRFLALVDDERIGRAEASLRERLGVTALTSRRFLDAGCGSGLFSLAARRLGATVVSFDFDPASVACAKALRRRYRPGDGENDWRILEGSVLDAPFLEGLGSFDVVYSWGVLHHTGRMDEAIDLTSRRAGPEGAYWIAIYNDQGGASRRWLAVKKAYNALPRGLRWLVVFPSFAVLWGPTFAIETARGHPGRAWRTYAKTSRGMSAWRDAVDWVGGLPFEVATPERILAMGRERGFDLVGLKTCGGGHGCNEFVFRRR